MITEFGRILRNIRMECNELLKDMADKLNITSSYLSAIEHGKREIPEGFVNDIICLYNLNETAAAEVKRVAVKSRLTLKLDLNGQGEKTKNLANAFARKLGDLDDNQINEMMNIIKKEGGD